MRIPRFAFALMLIAIFGLSGGLALVKARPGGNGPVLLLTMKISTKGAGAGIVQHCRFRTNSTDMEKEWCSSGTDIGVHGYVRIFARYIKREADRVLLAIKTKYSAEPTLADRSSDVLEGLSEEEYWLDSDRVLEVPVAGLGTMEISGEFIDYMPVVRNRPNEPFDPLPEEFRLWSPVLLCESRVLINMAPLKATDTGNDAAAMLYSPGLGRFIFSSVPIPGGIEGRLEANQISFLVDGKDYLLVTGAPISRSERVWVLYQPDWKPSVSESNPSGDHSILGANNLQHLLEMK